MARCRYCGGDPRERGHRVRCDGRQGHVEAALPLFEAPAPDPELPPLIAGLTEATWQTSATAAASVQDSRETQRARVLDVIRAAGDEGRTDDEIQTALGIDGSSERPRRWELWKLERIRIRRTEDGAPIRRLTRTNRSAVVWIVNPPQQREDPPHGNSSR